MSFALDNRDNNALRIRVWEAMQDVAQALRLRNRHMACDLAPLLWYQVLQGKVELPKYDVIFIDDAHALAPIGFKLLHQACQLTNKTSAEIDSQFKSKCALNMGHLFMMADRIQNTSSHVQTHQFCTWREANIQVIEHETVLSQCYRTSTDILQLANKFYPVEKQTSAYGARRKSTKRWRWPYKEPILFHLTQQIDEIDLLVKEISVLLDRGMQAKDILIVQAGQTSIRPLAMLLREKLDITVSVLGDPEYSEKTLYITALNTLSAIESPVVFIVGLQHLFSAKSDSNESKRRILYRGIMRAQHQLTLLLVADTIPAELQLKELKVVKNPTRKNNVYSLFPVSVF
jgi:superfamily I DNA/RNA helicase